MICCNMSSDNYISGFQHSISSWEMFSSGTWYDFSWTEVPWAFQLFPCKSKSMYFFSSSCKSPDTQGLKVTSRCGLQFFFYQGPLPPGAETGYPLYSPYTDEGLGIIHQSRKHYLQLYEAIIWLSVLLRDINVTAGTRTYSLLIKHQSLNPVFLTASSRHVFGLSPEVGLHFCCGTTK